ncbi:MAG TPA: peptidoglycan editing factor PgeF [Rickettsiales bacterium]|nr:peptidoglycan editing factor PgeF [Rickettsiales bacterium]
MFLTASNLSAAPELAHGFFTRNAGASEGVYASLNCGLGSADNAGHVIENRRRVAAALGTQEKHLCSLMQIHSADVVTVAESWENSGRPQGDAMVTNRPGVALGILTADCVPVLFADAERGVIGAAHSGWKGAFSGVLQNTIEAMIALGAKREAIACAIGPAIAQPSYEVGDEFRDRFLQRDAGYKVYFIPSRQEKHWLFDLKTFVRDTLKQTGIGNINMLENDTYIEEDAFFSFRRATHRGETDYGRQISAIMLKP